MSCHAAVRVATCGWIVDVADVIPDEQSITVLSVALEAERCRSCCAETARRALPAVELPCHPYIRELLASPGAAVGLLPKVADS